MFTGIVSGVGRVRSVPTDGGRLVVEHAGVAARLAVGGSVAVNGACLTAVEVDDGFFAAEVVPETLRRTNLGALEPGSAVNLEPALRSGEALDGHLVQGHVDATAHVRTVEPAGLGRELVVELPPDLARYVALKGSLAVDGVSLTVADLDRPPGTLRVALIPHTLAHTIAGGYAPGTLVNLEVDLVARYLERLVRASTVSLAKGAQ